MSEVSIVDARSGLDALIERASRGETIEIVDGGRPVARLVAPLEDRPPAPADGPVFDVEAMRRITASMTGPVVDSEDFWRRFRDDARY